MALYQYSTKDLTGINQCHNLARAHPGLEIFSQSIETIKVAENLKNS